MKNKKVSIFISNYTIGNSPSLINLLSFLSEEYFVDLYLYNVSLIPSSIKCNKKINCIQTENRYISSYYRIKNQLIGNNIYEFGIGVDPHGFYQCKMICPNIPTFYYSLELYLLNDHYGLNYPDNVIKTERRKINSIRGLIIQSHEKELLFRDDYQLSQEIPSFILPVTYDAPPLKEKSQFLHNKLNLNKNKKIALHLGGINWWHSCIEISTVFSRIDNWVLVFQGYYKEDYVQKLRKHILENKIHNVFILDEIFDSIKDIDKIIQSCSLGIAWYNDISIGFRTAGESSGKIPAYFRFGLPVVAKKYTSTYNAIEKTGCGLCVENYDDIINSLKMIENRFDYYSCNAIKEYEKKYRFEKYREKLLIFFNTNL